MRIVTCYPVEPRHVEQIMRSAPQAEVVAASQLSIARELLDADIFCGHAKGPVPWDEIVRRGRLRWIQSSAAGMDHCQVPSVVASDIVVCSASGVLADQVAEHTVALLTGLLRSLPVFFRAQQAREFIRRPTGDLHGATVGMVGLGANGRRIAQVLHPFRTRIWATDLFPIHAPPEIERLVPPSQLAALLPELDILILTAPLTDKTRGMIDAGVLSRMKPSAILVNVARGGLVEHDDLAAALVAGQIAGAALDVTDPEPLGPESPLWAMPQVIITPHVGGQSARRIDDMTRFFCENLRRYLADEPLVNRLADKRLGFPLPPGASLDDEAS